MQEIKNSQEDKWVLCHNGSDVFHIIHLTVGASLSSGQPILEKFNTEEQAIAKVKQLNPSYKLPNKK